MMADDVFLLSLKKLNDKLEKLEEYRDAADDQGLGKLFAVAQADGWTQEQIAERLAHEDVPERWRKKVCHQWVSQRLRLGRFVAFFSTTGRKECEIPADLTERKFRKLWEETKGEREFRGQSVYSTEAKKDEARRFREVLGMLSNESRITEESGVDPPRKKAKRMRPHIFRAIGDQPKWHTLPEVRDLVYPLLTDETERAELDTVSVKNCFYSWKPTPKIPYRVEKSGEGNEAHYRLVRVRGPIATKTQLAEHSAQLLPLLDQLIREAQKDRVLIDQVTLCALASRIKKVLESLLSKVSSETDSVKV